MSSPCCRTFCVTLEDGSIEEYSMRGLREDEIGAWASFCESVFSYKKPNPPPASYFERHFYNDPMARADLIRVVFWRDTTLVSSCRIFQKEISLGNGASVMAGGIGEVCTSSEHRCRGLSKRLLLNAMEIMRHDGIELSLLHAAPNFFPVYERGGGYVSTVSEWNVATIRVDRLKAAISTNLSQKTCTIRQAQFPNDTLQLKKLHQQFSEAKLVGCIIRSEAYWNRYVSEELGDTLHVLEDVKSKSIIAWMSIRQRGDRWQMREFGCDLVTYSVVMALPSLLIHCLPDFDASTMSMMTLHLPTFVCHSIKNCDFIESVVEENDVGWMYATLKHGGIDMLHLTKSIPHHIWPTDSF